MWLLLPVPASFSFFPAPARVTRSLDKGNGNLPMFSLLLCNIRLDKSGYIQSDFLQKCFKNLVMKDPAIIYACRVSVYGKLGSRR